MGNLGDRSSSTDWVEVSLDSIAFLTAMRTPPPQDSISSVNCIIGWKYFTVKDLIVEPCLSNAHDIV